MFAWLSCGYTFLVGKGLSCDEIASMWQSQGYVLLCLCVKASKQTLHWCCVNWKALWSLGRQDGSFHSSYHVQVFYHYVEGKRTERFIADHILWVECGHWAIMKVDTGLSLLDIDGVVLQWRVSSSKPI